jgi:imidazolonepropionase-like amidohydrolase
MPGMWDCHVHRKIYLDRSTGLEADNMLVMGVQTIDINAIVSGAQNTALTGARIARDVALLLNAGVTSVREMAGYGLQIAQGIKEGSVVGPNIYSSNKIIVSLLQN